MKARYEEIVNEMRIGTAEAGVNIGDIIRLAEMEEKNPAEQDNEQIELFNIDNQTGFISPLCKFSVAGAVGDTKRLCRFIYKYCDKITRIRGTFDWHSYLQIRFPSAWVYGKDFEDENGFHKAGENVLPNVTVITTEGIKDGRFKTILPDAEKAFRVVEGTEKAGKETRIWEYHCLENTREATLEGELNNIVLFHSIVRMVKANMYLKGTNTYYEQLGGIEAEFAEEDTVRRDILAVFANTKVKKFFFAGQAKSHCALITLLQIVEHFADRPDIIDKFYVLEDCMSCIAGFEEAAEKMVDELKKKGVHFVKSTDDDLMD